MTVNPQCLAAGVCLFEMDDGRCSCFLAEARRAFDDDFDADELGLDPEEEYDA